jgi:hypothetical protein
MSSLISHRKSSDAFAKSSATIAERSDASIHCYVAPRRQRTEFEFRGQTDDESETEAPRAGFSGLHRHTRTLPVDTHEGFDGTSNPEARDRLIRAPINASAKLTLLRYRRFYLIQLRSGRDYLGEINFLFRPETN